jgi:hypothetical protein
LIMKSKWLLRNHRMVSVRKRISYLNIRGCLKRAAPFK